MNERTFFTGNQLKMIALVAMTVDHVGAYIFTELAILRIIGRIAFPIFAYMLAEGCRYTGNKRKYLLILGGTATLFQIVSFLMTGLLKQHILVTFFLAAILCFLVDFAGRKESSGGGAVAVFFGAIAVFAVTEVLPYAFPNSGFRVDYGFVGVLFPVTVFAVKTKTDKLAAAVVMTVAVSLMFRGVQWYSLLALPLIALYNGRRGCLKMKYFYYAYFPFHLICIWCVRMLLC